MPTRSQWAEHIRARMSDSEILNSICTRRKADAAVRDYESVPGAVRELSDAIFSRMHANGMLDICSYGDDERNCRVKAVIADVLMSRRPGVVEFKGDEMPAEKVVKLNLERDYIKFLYFIDGNGNVVKKPKKGTGPTEIVVANAVTRDNAFLYYLDKDGDISRSPRAARAAKVKA